MRAYKDFVPPQFVRATIALKVLQRVARLTKRDLPARTLANALRKKELPVWSISPVEGAREKDIPQAIRLSDQWLRIVLTGVVPNEDQDEEARVLVVPRQQFKEWLRQAISPTRQNPFQLCVVFLGDSKKAGSPKKQLRNQAKHAIPKLTDRDFDAAYKTVFGRVRGRPKKRKAAN